MQESNNNQLSRIQLILWVSSNLTTRFLEWISTNFHEYSWSLDLLAHDNKITWKHSTSFLKNTFCLEKVLNIIERMTIIHPTSSVWDYEYLSSSSFQHLILLWIYEDAHNFITYIHLAWQRLHHSNNKTTKSLLSHLYDT